MTGETIRLDHGTGGLSQELIARRLSSCCPARIGEGISLELDVARIVVTADTFMVDPIFFGDCDIGRLAVCATVNDLAVRGALPRYLTVTLTIEQGLPSADLMRVLDSVRAAAAEADVEVFSGHARVVRSGEVDKLLIHVAGIGEVAQCAELGASRVRVGDVAIVTGGLADHGVRVLARRRGLDFAERVPSDCAALGGLVWNVLEDHALHVRCMLELSRGGLAGALHELADEGGVSIELESHRLPVGREARTAAECLGVDALHLPSVGSICLLVDGAAASDVLELVRWQPQGQAAQIVGIVRERGDSAVALMGLEGKCETVTAPSSLGLARLR